MILLLKIILFNLFSLIFQLMTDSLAPYNKIVNMDLASLIKLSNKYQSNHIFLIYLKHQDNIIFLDLNLFSLKEKNITSIQKFKFSNSYKLSS